MPYLHKSPKNFALKEQSVLSAQKAWHQTRFFCVFIIKCSSEICTDNSETLITGNNVNFQSFQYNFSVSSDCKKVETLYPVGSQNLFQTNPATSSTNTV